MAFTTYAAIDIGSSKISMKIYELSGTKGIRELSLIRHPLALGADVYTNGSLSYQTTQEICRTLNDFKRIMNDFDVDECQVYTTSGIREAKNSGIVIDQIKLQTDFDIKPLSNSEARFLYFKALAMKEESFHEMIENGTLIVDIGGGSVQLSIFDKGTLCITQNLLLGSTRIQELLHVMEDKAYDFNDLVDEYVEKDLTYFQKIYLSKTKIKNVIVIGDLIPELYHKAKPEGHTKSSLLFSKKTMKKALHFSFGTNERTQLVTPTIILCRKIADITGCHELTFSNVDFCDGMAAEMAEKKLKYKLKHDFTKDILTASENIARKFMTDMDHVENVQVLALQIFDKIRKFHGLGKRERLLLQISVILHSCGIYIDSIDARECAYRIIMSSEIIGLSHKERVMIANIVRYNSSAFPSYAALNEDFSKEEYITVIKLNCILRIANVLDKSNRHKIHNISVSIKDDQLIVTADTMTDITLEQGLFDHKAVAFQNVFGVKPVLRQKRSGKRG